MIHDYRRVVVVPWGLAIALKGWMLVIHQVWLVVMGQKLIRNDLIWWWRGLERTKPRSKRNSNTPRINIHTHTVHTYIYIYKHLALIDFRFWDSQMGQICVSQQGIPLNGGRFWFTLLETNMSHLWKRKIIFPTTVVGEGVLSSVAARSRTICHTALGYGGCGGQSCTVQDCAQASDNFFLCWGRRKFRRFFFLLVRIFDMVIKFDWRVWLIR